MGSLFLPIAFLGIRFHNPHVYITVFLGGKHLVRIGFVFQARHEKVFGAQKDEHLLVILDRIL